MKASSRQPNGEILDRNIGLLLRRAYDPALPGDAFRSALAQTWKREARRRFGTGAADAPERRSSPSRWILVAAAAGILIGLFLVRGAWLERERAGTPEEIVARGDVALLLEPSEIWRSATPAELEEGILVDRAQLALWVPAAASIRVNDGSGALHAHGPAELSVAATSDGVTTIELARGDAWYDGPAGRIDVEAGVALRLEWGVRATESRSVAPVLAAQSMENLRQAVLEPPTSTEPSVGTESTSTDPARPAVRGRVVGPDGAPIRRFRVGLLPQREAVEYQTPRTREFESEDGSFVWEDAPEGRQGIFVHASGYAIAALGSETLEAGVLNLTERVGGPVTLEVGGEIRGFVFDAVTKSPIADALVLAERDAPQTCLFLGTNALRMWIPTSTRTAADGSFRLEHVSLGRHELRITAPGYAAEWSGSVEIAEDAPVPSVEIGMTRGAALSGNVTRSDGTPWVDAMLIATPMEQGTRPQLNFAQARTDRNGDYRFEDLPFGSMLAVLVDVEGGVRPRVKPVELRPGTSSTCDFVGAREGTALRGIMRDTSGEPVAFRNIALFEESVIRSNVERERFEATTTLADGSYSFGNVPPGRYFLFLVERQGRWIQLSASLDVPDWAEFEHDVEVSDYSIAGTVRDGLTGELEPSVSFVLLLEDPASGESIFAGNVISDAEGAFELVGLPAGLYTVCAYPGRDGLGFARRTALVLGDRTPRVELDVQLPLGTSVEIEVVDATGAPVDGATVIVTDDRSGARGFAHSLRTEADGRVRVRGLIPGRYLASTLWKGATSTPITFECDSNETRSIRLRVDPASAEESQQ